MRPFFRRGLFPVVLTVLFGIVSSAQGDTGGLSAGDLVLLNRVTWGASESSAEALRRIGRESWLEGQLHPPAGDALPAAVQAQIDAMAISQRSLVQLFGEMVERSKALGLVKDPVEKAPLAQAHQQAMTDLARQAAARSILRDLYSPSQLREQMTWFWFNHFNVHQYKADIRPMLADYEETAIRPHALGRFRDLLAATVRHPAMLRYLDNAENAAGHINENYAREIMELHTLGLGDAGHPAVYSQADVQELARILTGVGIDARTEDPKLKPELQSQLMRNGLFEFNPARHDQGEKSFLGHVSRPAGMAEVDEAIDILSREPATARHVSAQIAGYFLGDAPPPTLVADMAATFQRTDGDIAAVLSVLFHAPAASEGVGRFKDPVHYVMSAVRLAYDDKVILNTLPVQGWLNRMAQGLFNKDTPDGYAMSSQAWSGPGQLAVRFEIARQIGSGSAGLFKPDLPGAVDRPGFPQLQNALYFGGLRHTLGPATRAALAEAISPQDWNTLYLSSPEFMY